MKKEGEPLIKYVSMSGGDGDNGFPIEFAGYLSDEDDDDEV